MCRLSLSTSFGVCLHKKYNISRKELYAHNENASGTPSSKVLRYRVNKFFDVHVHCVQTQLEFKKISMVMQKRFRF